MSFVDIANIYISLPLTNYWIMQNCIADAMSNAQNPAGGPPMQGYNPYPSQDPVYGSSRSSAAEQASHVPAGDYGSMYGASYGY